MSGLLVVGRTGQLARALAHLAEERGRTDLAFAGREELDLMSPGAAGPLIAALRPRAVIAAAAYTAVDRAEAERAAAFRINAEAVGEIAAAAAAVGAPLVHVSTDYVYPGTGTAPHREDAETAPVNAYGESKLAGERAARAANPRTAILRTSWVYAPWGKNFVATMLRLADKPRLTIVDDQIGQPTSALDLAEGCLRAADRLAAGDDVAGLYHLAGRGETSWAGFARRIFAKARALGLIETAPEVVPIPTEDYPTPAKRPLNSRLCLARYETTFAHPLPHWEAALDRVLALIPRAEAKPG